MPEPEYLTVYTKDETFLKIPKSKCIDVELFLNKSENGKKWVKLGDKLYYFNNPRNDNDRINLFLVEKEQLVFIRDYLQGQ